MLIKFSFKILDGGDLKEEVMMEIEKHEQMILQITNTDSQERLGYARKLITLLYIDT